MKIVTGVDSSTSALHAARKAAVLATALTAELHVLTAYNLTETKSFTDNLEKAVEFHAKAAERTASEVAVVLREDFPSLVVNTITAEGNPAAALVSAADRLGADLIVVGNRRVQGPGRILGSIARSVAAQAPCDLYIVNTRRE